MREQDARDAPGRAAGSCQNAETVASLRRHAGRRRGSDPLLGFLDTIERNVQGTIDDVDTEFLHDLRVAVRRTRSLIKLTGDVLPPRVATRFAPRFKWLSDLTTPTRDLDVYLLQLDHLRTRLAGSEPGALDPFAEHLRRERRAAHTALVRDLGSPRFAQLCASWRSELTGVVEPWKTSSHERAGSNDHEVEHLAADRVRRMHDRVVKRARAITPDSPADRIHALRKRCKELRYLLEVFRPLYTSNDYTTVLTKLKRVQDILGEFQDGEVQSDTLRTHAQRMLDEQPAPPAETLLAMDELSAHFASQQRRARDDLVGALPHFLGTETRQRIETMLP